MVELAESRENVWGDPEVPLEFRVLFSVSEYLLIDIEVFEDASTVPNLAAVAPTPMVDGERGAIVRIVPTFLTGRRLAHGVGTGDVEPPAPRVS